MNKRVYTLYRVSTMQQVYKDKDADDIPMQRQACKEFALMQGWDIVKEFEEKGISGFKVSANDRDAIRDLKEAAEAHEFDILLVFMFDRIGRMDDETPFVVEWFVKHGISVWSVKEGEQRFESHVDKLTNYIRFWQAAGESEKTSMRIKTRVRQLTLEGCYTGGAVPYGYRLVQRGRLNKRGVPVPDLEIDEAEAENVREIYRRTVLEGVGSHQMASYLNDHGYRTHTGSKFTSTTILRILKNEKYCGTLVNGEVTSETLESLRIVERDVYERAQSIISQRAVRNDGKRTIAMSNKGKAMLSGNIFCAHCGGRLTTTSYRDKYVRKDGSVSLTEQVRYICYHRSRKLCDCDGQASYDAERIDRLVCEVMRKLFAGMKGAPEKEKLQTMLRHKASSNIAKQQKLQKQLEKDERRLSELQLKIADILIGDSPFSADDLSSAINALKKRIAETADSLSELHREEVNQTHAADLLTPTYNRFKSWVEEFDTASNEQRKMIACQLFSRIEVGKGYKISFEVSMDYRQFCKEWGEGNIADRRN